MDIQRIPRRFWSDFWNFL